MIYTDLGPCLKRESDGAFIPKDPANTDYARAVQEVAEGISTVEQPPAVDPTPARIAAAWSAADKIAREGVDENARARFTIWLIEPESSPAKKQAIRDCVAWMDQIWSRYAVVKAQIQAGQDAQFTFDTPCPYNFWQIAAL